MPPTTRHPRCQHNQNQMHPKEKDGQAECVYCELNSWSEDKSHVPSIHDSILTLAMSEKTHIDTLRILAFYLACVTSAISDIDACDVVFAHPRVVMDVSTKLGKLQIFTFSGGVGRVRGSIKG